MSTQGQTLRDVSGISLTSGTPPTVQAVQNVYQLAPTGSGALLTESPGCIMSPLQFVETANPNTGQIFSRLDGSGSGLVWEDDYGATQAATVAFTSAYRLLSMGVRVRIVGLPSGVFMTPGKIYFAQVRWHKDDVPITEEDFVQLERLGRATHVSMDAVRASGSKTFYAIPDSDDKFEMSSSFYPAPGVSNANDWASGGVAVDTRLFTNLNFVNGGSLSSYDAIAPYNTSGTVGSTVATQDAADQQVADQTILLQVACFGLQAGVVLEVDYASNYEIIPTAAAPPGVETSIQLPSSQAMDAIFAGVAVAAAIRPQLLQADGDRTITDVPMSAFGDSAEARITRTRAEATKSLLARAPRSLVGACIRPGRAEGFWDFDWLGKGSFGNDKTGGISWDFAGEKGGKSKSKGEATISGLLGKAMAGRLFS
jgi:hypothetical protein